MTPTEQHLNILANVGSVQAKFILAHGRTFEPDALTFFGNAAELVLKDPTLTYVEGTATAARLLTVHKP